MSELKHNKIRLIENATSLLFLQAANYLLPLITLPYLVRILGIDQYGLLNYAFVIIQYFIIFVDYGFNISATRQVSIFRDDKEKLSNIFNSVYIVKTILMLIAFAILLIIIFTVGKIKTYSLLYLISYLSVVGNILFPVWYFQGLEKMKYVTVINILSRILITVLIFVFVKTSKDYLLAALLQSMSVVVAGATSIIFVAWKMPVKPHIPSYDVIKNTLLSGWPIFISNMSVNMFTNTNIMVLGIYCDNKTVGRYSIGYKIVAIVLNLINPIAYAVFPYISKLFADSFNDAIRFIRKLFLYGSISFIILGILMNIFAQYITTIIAGQNDQVIVNIIRLLSVMPLLTFIDNVYGMQILLNNNKEKEFMRSLLFGGCLSIALSFWLVPLYKEYGSAVSLLIAEFAVVCLMYRSVKKIKISLF